MSNATTTTAALEITIAIHNGNEYETVSGGGWEAPQSGGESVESAVRRSMVGGDFDGMGRFRLTATADGEEAGEFYFDAADFARGTAMKF